MSRYTRMLAILLIAALLPLGCDSAQKSRTLLPGSDIPLTGQLPKGPVPTYATIAARHNERVSAITQFTAQAQMEIFYQGRDGKRHYEQADQCRVVMVLPDQMAVLIRKFGVGDLFWAGSDEARYWLFDLTQSDRRLLYLGRKDGDPQAVQTQLPVPVHPRDLPMLMGLALLPAGEGSAAAVKGGYLVTPENHHWRMVVDAQTFLPVRVEMLEGKGEAQATALLSRPDAIQTYEKPPAGWPRMASRIELRPRGSADAVVVHLSALEDGREFDTIQPRVFDLQRLIKTYKPDETIQLE